MGEGASRTSDYEVLDAFQVFGNLPAGFGEDVDGASVVPADLGSDFDRMWISGDRPKVFA